MALGPGKYDNACAEARKLTGGSTLLIVFGGVKGHGFSAQVDIAAWAAIPKVLRDVADQIERDQFAGRV